MRIVFVLSGKSNKGLGHIMRCRLLAKALQDEGCMIEFLFDELSTKHRPFVEPFSFVCCQHKARSANELLIDALCEYTQQSPIDWVVLDDYEFDLGLEQAITELGVKLAVFDDILRQHHCDVLIDSRWCGETTYDNYSSSEVAQKLLGPNYACIAQSPQVDPGRNGNPNFKVMMSLGGGGDLLLLKPYLDVLLEDSNSADIEYQVVIGPFAINAEELIARYSHSPNIEFIQGAVDLTSYLANIDFYIGAAGGTLLQMLAHRIPSLTFSIASNQDNNVEHLTQLGHPFHFNQGDDVDVAFLPLFIAAARKNYHRLVSSIVNAPVQIDFRGAKRIGEVMLREGGAIPMSASPKSASPKSANKRGKLALIDGDIPTLLLALGVHVEHLCRFITGGSATSVEADFSNFSKFKGIVDDAHLWVDHDLGFKAKFWVSKSVLGHKNVLKVDIYGLKGWLTWVQAQPEALQMLEFAAKAVHQDVQLICGESVNGK